METNTINTFWKLINKHQIEIPIIQRDYAQGRIEKRINQIRINFIESLIKSLNTSTLISLGFIYGKIDGKEQKKLVHQNREAVHSMLKAVKAFANGLDLTLNYELNNNEANCTIPYTKLIPLDGQQRLTTLFLLHWYLIQRSTLDNSENHLKKLSAFRYQTRTTTKDFCIAITSIENKLSKESFNTNKLSDNIINNTWFLRNWLRDPSVKGMLETLNEINNQFNKITSCDYNSLLKKLLFKEIIQFDFLDLDELKQTDELYVKMNARGKSLTDFEHFKAWLQQNIHNNLDDREWEYKVDTEWYDLFWENKQEGGYEIDSTIYNYFKNISLLNFIAEEQNKETLKKIIDVIVTKKNEYIPHKLYKDMGFFSTQTLNFLFTTLNSLRNKKLNTYNSWLSDIYLHPFTKNKNLPFRFLSNNIRNIDYYDRVYYYAFILFINDENSMENNADKENTFKDWMRITRNLIYNTYIQNSENFIDAIKSLKILSQHKYNISNYFLSSNINIQFYSKIQIQEESIKLHYFKINGFKTVIEKFENNNYLHGQIGFLFNLLPNEKREDLTLFESLSNKVCKYFEKSEEDDNWRLQCKLLQHENYFTHVSGNKYRFNKNDAGSLRARNDNWRKIFNAKKDSKAFIALNNVINNSDNSSNENLLNDWRKYFIQYPEIFSYCKETLIDFYHPFDIRLIKQKTYNGKHADLYTYILYLKCREYECKYNEFSFKYIDVNNFRTENNIPYLEINKNGKPLYNIIYYPNPSNENGELRLESKTHLRSSFLKEFIKDNKTRITPINSFEDYDKFNNVFLMELSQSTL